MRTIANDIIMPEIGQLLDEGIEVTLRAKGRSMHPYIRDGKDLLVLQRMNGSDARKGDIVLAHVADGRFVVHRVVKTNGDELTLMGDGNLYGTEQCRRSDIMGQLVFVERNGRRIDCNSRGQRLKAWWLRTAYRALAKAYHHSLGRLKKAKNKEKR